MSKGARNRRIRIFARKNVDEFNKTHHTNLSSKSLARRIRRVGWFGVKLS